MGDGMSLGNFGVYKDIFEGIGRYKGFRVELEDGSLREVREVKIDLENVVLILEEKEDKKGRWVEK